MKMEKNQIVLRVYQMFYLTLFFFFLTDVAFSQGARDNVKNEYVREIVVEGAFVLLLLAFC